MISNKKSWLLIVTVILTGLGLNSAEAQVYSGKKIGLGVMFGEPTGINVKYRATDLWAFDVGVARSLHETGGAIHLYSDYLLHFWIDAFNKGRFGFYYGIGGRIVFVRKATAGIRIPIGLNYLFEDAPVDIFIAGGPIVDFSPATIFRGTGVIGMHYYF